MKNEPFRQTILVSQLLLDVSNPRFPEVQNNQREAIRTMASTQSDKIIALAEHIVSNGTNPASIPIVMTLDSEDDNMYCVLDGNRRVTALKILETPSLINGIFKGSQLKKIKDLAATFKESPTTELNCVVFSDRDDADEWISLIHRGEQQGIGLVEWDGQVAARYDARKGGRGKRRHFALDVLDYVLENAELSEATTERIDAGKFPITNLERLVNTPYVRDKLGIDRGDDGGVVVKYPEDEVLKGLARIVDDLGTSRVTVSKIKNQTQRIDYVNNFSEESLPEPETALPDPKPLGGTTTTTGKPVKKNRRRRSKSTRRSTLIPKGCILEIPTPRINKLYIELKHIHIDDFPNASAVLLRVFIELSLDYFLENTVQWSEKKIENSKLRHKLSATENYLKSNDLLSDDELAPVRKAASGHAMLAASVKSMHAYVHNRFFSAIPSELTVVWDDFQSFLEKIWTI